jgi:hypothetical protein
MIRETSAFCFGGHCSGGPAPWPKWGAQVGKSPMQNLPPKKFGLPSLHAVSYATSHGLPAQGILLLAVSMTDA